MLITPLKICLGVCICICICICVCVCICICICIYVYIWVQRFPPHWKSLEAFCGAARRQLSPILQEHSIHQSPPIISPNFQPLSSLSSSLLSAIVIMRVDMPNMSLQKITFQDYVSLSENNNLLRLASFPNSQPSSVNYKESNIQHSQPFICSYSQSCWWLDVEYVDIERRWALELLSENNLETLWVTPSHSRAYQRLRRYFTKIDWQGHANW